MEEEQQQDAIVFHDRERKKKTEGEKTGMTARRSQTWRK